MCMKLKSFISIDDQIELLQSEGLVIDSVEDAKTVLSKTSYYVLINGYREPFISEPKPRRYKDGANFKELLSLYQFDTFLRNLIFPEILLIEEQIKTACVYEFSDERKPDGSFAHQGDDYLDETSYETINDTKTKCVGELIASFKKTKEECNADSYAYYLKEYNYIPLWVFATNMSFSQTSRFYESLKQGPRTKVAKRYGCLESDLRTVLKCLNVARNICAHNGRLYCANIAFYLPNAFSLSHEQRAIDGTSKRKFGSILYCLELLLPPERFARVVERLNESLRILSTELTSIKIAVILKRMGISKGMISHFKIAI